MILISVGPDVDYTAKLAKEICPHSGPMMIAEESGAFKSYLGRLMESTNKVYKVKRRFSVANDDIAVHFASEQWTVTTGLLLTYIGIAHYLKLDYELHSRVVLEDLDDTVYQEFNRKFKVHYE